MADYPREYTEDEQRRELQDQVRRKWTQMPPTGISWSPQEDDAINTAGGWYRDGFPFLTFYRENGLVTVFGLISWLGNSAGSWVNPHRILLEDIMPESFRPASITRVLGYGSTGSPEDSLLWSLYIYGDTGQMLVSTTQHTAGVAIYPWAEMEDDGRSINIMASYPAGELGLGL